MKYLENYLDKNRDKLLKMGSTDAILRWFANRITIGLFFFFTVITITNIGELTMQSFIVNITVNALVAWGMAYIPFFLVRYNSDKEKGDKDDI